MRRDPSEALAACTASDTVILIVDAQEDFLGVDAAIPVPGSARPIDGIKALVAGARRWGAAVVWTRVVLDSWTQGPYRELWPEHFSGATNTALRENSANSQIVAELKPLVRADDYVLVKPRYSAFQGTQFCAHLHAQGIENLIVGGVTTNVCVESTVRDAFQLGFRPFLVRECTGTFTPELQRAAEEVVSMVFGYVVDMKAVSRLMMSKSPITSS